MSPTFVVIGAMRSGTTSFHALLDSHPQIHMSPIKGPGLFLDEADPIRFPSKYQTVAEKRDFKTDDEILAAICRGAVGEALIGESTDFYTRYPVAGLTAPAKMMSLNPDLKLIYLLRHPLARLQSQFHYEQSKPFRPAPSSFDDYLEQENGAVATSKYFFQLSRYLEVGFQREQICVVILEELIQDLRGGMRVVEEFLGISAMRATPLPMLNRRAGRPRGQTAAPFTRDQFDLLNGELAADVSALEAWLDRKLDRWCFDPRTWVRREPVAAKRGG